MQCRAHRKSDGEPCRLHAIRGGTVCRKHGGSAPQVRAMADVRATVALNAYLGEPIEQLLNWRSRRRRARQERQERVEREAARLRRQGLSFREIAKRQGVAASTASARVKRAPAELAPPDPDLAAALGEFADTWAERANDREHRVITATKTPDQGGGQMMPGQMPRQMPNGTANGETRG